MLTKREQQQSKGKRGSNRIWAFDFLEFQPGNIINTLGIKSVNHGTYLQIANIVVLLQYE